MKSFLDCFNADTLLKFDKLGNDNAYGTILEFLAQKVKRIELDDEFINQLRNDENVAFDFLKITSQSRSEMYYTKSYFDIEAKEFDVRDVCSPNNMSMFSM